MDIRFDGQRALVTGAGRGIGNSIAKALAAGGAETIALSRTQENLDKLKAELAASVTDTHLHRDRYLWPEAASVTDTYLHRDLWSVASSVADTYLHRDRYLWPEAASVTDTYLHRDRDL
ncbi:hypothetical protein LSAT2_011667 [Lamellibrachia satsuma]|nr:hypothetical protein LSAT2_011667 [Lamellibrachia satsuma]